MTNGSQRRVFVWPLALLIILIIVFHSELFVIGTRLYVAVAKSPNAETMLADYYQHSSERQAEYAHNYYLSAMADYKSALNTAADKGSIQVKIARLYECGKGTKIDLAEAKQWYSDASSSSNAEAATEAKQGLARIDNAIQTNAAIVCEYPSDIKFLVKTLIN